MTSLHSISTLVPETRFSQDAFGEVQASACRNPKRARFIEGIYRESGIASRHSVVLEKGDPIKSEFYSLGNGHPPVEPSTKDRNDRFGAFSAEMAPKVAGASLAESGFSPHEVTHLVTVSCTGFQNPGMDLDVVAALGLPSNIERYHIGFMGCYAAFPALRLASHISKSDPGAVVLVVCVELCSLHFQCKDDLDTLVANSLFSDGAAAAVVSARAPQKSGPRFGLLSFSSSLLPHGAKDMAWTVGNAGFDIVLSKYVPRILGENVKGLVEKILQKESLSKEDISAWAIHPGGKAILTKFEENLELKEGALESSRGVLRRFGNMSAATIFFVLKDILQKPPKPNAAGPVFAAAFGPGLTVETALLRMEQA